MAVYDLDGNEVDLTLSDEEKAIAGGTRSTPAPQRARASRLSSGLLADPEFRSKVAQIETDEGIPQGLIHAVIAKESSGNPDSISPADESGKRAWGLGQFRESTAKSIAESTGIPIWQNGRVNLDPDVQLSAMAALLRQNKENLGGDWYDAAWAYHAGPDNVRSYKSTGRYSAYEDKIDPNYKSDIIRLRSRLENQGVDTSEPEAKKSILDYGIPMTPEIAAWEPEKPAAPAPAPTAPASPSAMDRVKQGLSAIQNIDLSGPNVKKLHPPVPQNVPTFDPDYQEMEKTLNMTLAPGYVERVKNIYEAATPEDRQKLLSAPGQAGAVARYVDKKYQASSNLYGAVPELQSLSGRREDVEARNRLNGMEPLSAKTMADREVRFGSRPIFGQAKSTDFNFERAAELNGRSIPEQEQPQDQTFGDRVINAAEKTWNSSAIRRGAIQGEDLLKGQAAGMHKMIADAGEMMGVPGAAAYGRAQTAARQKLGMRQNEMGQSPDKFTRAFEGAIASTISNAPGLAVGLLRGGEVVPLLMMSTQVAGDEYSNGVEHGLTKSQALSRAVAFGAMEYIGEKLGFKDQIDMIKSSVGGNVQNLEKLFLKNLSEQIAGEELTTLGEWRIDKSKAIGLNPDSTAKELLEQMKDTFYQTVMQTAIMGAPGAAAAVKRKLRESDARYDQPFADAFKPVRETHAARDVYDTTIRTPLGELRNDPEYREIVSNQTNIDESGLARGRAARQILAERRASNHLGHIETNGVPYAESTNVSNTGNDVPSAGQDLETQQVTGSSGGQQNAETQNGQKQEGLLLGGTEALNRAAYSITNPDPFNEDDEPLSASDALFELEVLRDRANKGKLNTEVFAWSPIGKRLDTNVLGSFLGEIKAGRFGFIDQIANRIKETTGAQQNTETGQADGSLQPRSQVQSLPTSESGAGVQSSGQENRDLTQEIPVGPFSMQRGPGGIAILDGSGTPVSTHQTMADAIEAFDQLSAQSSQQEHQDELQTSAASGNQTGPGQIIQGSGQQTSEGTEQGSGQEAQQEGHYGLKPAESLLKQAEAQDALGNKDEAQRLRNLVVDLNNGIFVPEAYLDADNSNGTTGSGVSESSGGKQGASSTDRGAGSQAGELSGGATGAGALGVSGQASSEAGNAGSGGDGGLSLKERREQRQQRKASEAPVIQNRDRSNPASIQQMQSIAANPHYLRLGPGNDFSNGAPIVVGTDIPEDQLGKEDIAVTAKNREIPFRYAVVEASKLVASHNADGTPNPDYDVTPTGKLKVIAGNGRVAGLQKAHKQGSAFGYVNGMFSDEHRHGINPSVIGGKLSKPVLVRVIPESEVTKDIGDESNIGNGLELSPLEKAKNDAQRFDLDGLDFTDDGEINERTVKQFVRTMPENEQGGLIDTDGTPNRDAYDRLKAAIFYKAYQNEELVRIFSQAADPEARLVMSALARVAPKMARLEGTGYEDINDLVAEAAVAIVNGKRNGLTMRMIADQIDITHQPGTADVLGLFADNPRSNKIAIEALSDMADFAFEESNNPGVDLFGDRHVATRQDVLERLRKYRGNQKESMEHAGGSEPPESNDGSKEAGREGQGDAREVQRGEQEDQGREEALAPIKERRAARKTRKSSFATPEQEQARVDLFHRLAFLRGRLSKAQSAFNRREIEKEIKQIEKEFRKLPEGMLTERGATDLRGKNVADSELVKTWLQGANDVLDYEAKNPSGKTADELWEEYAATWGKSGQTAPISKAYFQKVLADRAGLSPEEIADDINIRETEGLIEQVKAKFGEARVQQLLDQSAKDMVQGKGGYFPLVRKALEDLLKNSEIVTPAEGDLFGAPTKEDQQRAAQDAVNAYANKKAVERNATGQAVEGGLFDQDNRQSDVFSKPATRMDRLASTGAGEAPPSAETQKAQRDLDAALGDLGQVFLDANLFAKKVVPTPELDEAKLIPVLARLLDAAFRLGYHKFKDAAKFALDTIRAKFGDAAADAITLDHLQGSYIAMSGKYRDQGADTKKDVVGVESLAEIIQGETDVTNRNSNSNLESDRENSNAQNGLGQDGVPAGSGRNGRVRESGIQESEGDARSLGGGELSGRQAVPPRESSDLKIFRGSTESAGSDAGDSVGIGSGPVGVSGSPIEPDAAEQIEEAARSRSEVAESQAEQSAADKENHAGSSLSEIRAALPMLLPGQQEDVQKAETRFSLPDGYGMLFTNGTGTGKTFTGLGIIKRFANKRKTNILILAPSDKIISDWISSGRLLNLEINPLENTKDVGKGITITTYANFGANEALAARNWDLTVADEAHYLMQDSSGTPTHVIQNLRAITKHPDGIYRRTEMLHSDLRDEMTELSTQIDSVSKRLSNPDTMDSMLPDLQKILADLEPKLAAARNKWEAAKERVKADVAASQNESRPRSLFLSATPFAYEPTVDWANGYLFDYNEGQPDESKEFRGYNSGQNKDRFFMTHFGYRMRYNKLTKPDAKVDSGLMQRQFNTWLKKRGSLSGRMLDVAADYDRRFILVESAIGTRIDQALEWFHDEVERVTDAGGNPNGVRELEDAIGEKFDYLSRRYLLEAIKATEVIKHVKEHMALGRKVVVFHDYKKGGGFHPFKMERRSDPLFNEALERFNAEFRDLLNTDFASMPNPIEVFKREFPDVLLFNGDVSKKQRRANVEKFQSDDSGPQVFLAQTAAAREGISLHDTTGKHQRVLLNLGQPTQPTTSIQQEGRIYRTGQVTDAIFRYLNTGTNWEKWAFATTIAQRASAAENLGMGEQARALKDAFIAAFEESDNYRAGMEGEGKGGKERDRLANEALTEWDRAKAFYYGTQKKTSKTKAQEGADYFATPEPLGLKMVEWLQLLPGEKALEPSAGHGAIARWLPENVERTAVEPSRQLLPKLAMVFDGKIVDTNFEQHNVVNKYDGIVMNPPFGSGGKTAVDHLAKAAQHLRDGGRIVALIPAGPASDKQFSKFYDEETRIPVAPLLNTKELGPVYAGDTIKTSYSWMQEGKVVGKHNDQLLVRRANVNGLTHVDPSWVTELKATGRREKVARQAENLFMVADIRLPSSVFERAGTGVNTHIVVLEKQEDPEKAKLIQQTNKDYTSAKDINDFFDRIEDASLPARVGKDQTSAEEETTSQAKSTTSKGQAEGNRYVTDAPAITYTTKSGKTLEGVIARDLSQDEAKAIDPYTWKKDGGYFIRMKHVDRPQPMFSRSQVFYSALERGINSSKIETQPATQWRAWLQSNKAKLGIKDEEIAWTGLDDYLILKGKERLSKDDITAFLKDNGVQVSEVTRLPIAEMSDDRVREEYYKDLNGREDPVGFEPTVDFMREWLTDVYQEGTHGTPKYEQWSFFDAGRNYRELLLTLPAKSEREVADGQMKAFTDRVTKRLGREGWGLDSLTLAESVEYDQLNNAAMKASSKKPVAYKSSHWSEPNVLAHIRFNDRTDADGNRVLFIEELQSDWAQEGRKKGFKGEKYKGYEVSWEGRPIMIYETKEEAEAHVSRALKNDPSAPVAIKEVMARGNVMQEAGKVDAAPFVKDTKAWVSLAMKRIIRYAAEGGYDKVAFVTGEQAADRFDLSNQVDSILYKKNNDGTYTLSAQVHGRGQLLGETISEDALEDHVGKEIAQKIVNGEGRKTEVQGKYDPSMPFGKTYMNELSGVDLKVGGKGMKTYYDEIVPQVANDVLKKLGGGRLENVELDARSPGSESWFEELTDKDIQNHPGFVISPTMREKAMAGLPLFVRNVGRRNPAGRSLNFVDKTARIIWEKLDIAPGVNLRTVETEADLPKEILDRAAKEGALGTIEALEHKGTIYLVADKHTSALHIEESLLHEATHLGSRLFYGRSLRRMYTKLYFALGREAGIRDWAKRHGFNMESYFVTAKDMVQAGTMDPTQRFAYLAEEFLAHAQGSKAYYSLPRKALQMVREILGAIRNWMKSKGLIESSKLNDADLAYLLRKLHRAAQGRESANSGNPVFKRSDSARFSRGKVIPQTATAAFKRWFGNSKVTDENGNPMRMYHATPHDFDVFHPGGKAVLDGEYPEGQSGTAIWFSPYKDHQAAFHNTGARETEFREGTRVMPVYLKIERPLIIDDNGMLDWARDVFAEGSKEFPQIILSKWKNELTRDDEYDGIIFKGEALGWGANSDEYIVFKPTQIKSAIGNNGDFDPENPDIRFSRKNVLGEEPAATWTAPSETRLDDFIYRMQDKLIDTKRVEQTIKNIEDEWSPYQKEMLYHGRAAKQTEDFLTNEVKPLVKAMQDKGVSMDELETYLWNRHAQERNEQIAKINPRMEDGGSGILTQDAQDYLSSLPADKLKDLDALAGLVDKINSGTKKLLIDSGLEVPETIAAWDDAYKFYVPLMRGESDISHRGNGTGQGFSVKGPASKRAMGSDRPVVDILANIMMQRERTIVRAEKNRVAVALYGLAIQNENPNFWLPVNPQAIRAPRKTRNELQMMGLEQDDIDGLMREPATRYIDQQSGLVASRINPALRNRDNVLAVRINGKDRFVFFNTNDPRAARMVESLKNLDTDQLGSFLSGVRLFTHAFASMNTQYNPVFGVVNLTRDLGAGALNLTSTAIAGKEKEVLLHVGPAITGIYADLRADRAGKPRSSGQWSKLWEDFQEHGGKTGYRDLYRTSEDRAKAIQKMLDPSSWADHGLGRLVTADGRLKAPMDAVRKTASPIVTPLSGWLSDFNETMENAIRLSAYRVAIDSGLSTDKAAVIAKNLTVNFNKKGQLATQLGALYAFFNANAQGTARIIETLNGPAGKKIIAGGLLVGVIQALMMAAAGYEDDEPPQFARERNLVIPVGNRYFSIPYALGYHVIPNTGRILTELLLSGGENAGDKVFDLMAAYIEAFNPMGSGKSISEVLSPTVTDPIVALERNTDAFGRPIAKLDRSELNPTPGFTRAKDTASAFGKWFSEVINTLTGGSDYRPGRVSPTPDQIDYLIGQATGGVGREAMKVEQTVSSLVSGEELPPHKIPLLGRFYGNVHSASAEANRFYQNVTRLNEHEAEIKGLAKNGGDYQTYMKKHPETQLIASANALQSGVSELRARKRLAMTKGSGKEQVKLIENQITVYMKSLNDRMRALEAKQ